jgi:hypothetical protein
MTRNLDWNSIDHCQNASIFINGRVRRRSAIFTVDRSLDIAALLKSKTAVIWQTHNPPLSKSLSILARLGSATALATVSNA